MMKNTNYYISKITALRNACDDLLTELQAETQTAPKQRHNKRETRILNFDAQYNKKKSKTVA